MAAQLRRDEEALGTWVIIAVIVVVALLLVAVVVMAGWTGDKLDGNKPTGDTVSTISCTVKVGDLDNQVGQIEARDVTVETDVTDYSGEDPLWSLSVAGIFDIFKNEFDLTCQVRCTGPGGFEAEAHDDEHVEVDEWVWGETSVSFDTLRFFVDTHGTYELVLKIYVDSEDEGIDNELAYSVTKEVVA